MRHRPFRIAVLAVPLALIAAGCTPIRARQGYILDQEIFAGIQPGVDNKESVLKTMGRPTFESQFGPEQWYYVSRNTSQFAFRVPRASSQTNIRISFAADGTVAAVDQTGLDQVAAITPSDRKTPTLGRERSFFEELFGGIGTVGSGIGGSGGRPSGQP